MQMSYPEAQVPNPLAVMRKAGYFEFTDPNTHKKSFILRPTSERYPRWHLYLKHENGQVIFDLHLDQKKPSYSGTRMHAGEYEGPTVKRELERIAKWVGAVKKGM